MNWQNGMHLNNLIDSHIHLDQFSDAELVQVMAQPIEYFIGVSNHWASFQRLVALKQRYPQIQLCLGFHPEQSLPSESEKNQLFDFIAKNHQQLTALGEVGLPHYLKRQQPNLDYQPYIDLLEQFVAASKRYDLPLNLHIVYDDTDIALALLAKYQIHKAHFHWFKADEKPLAKFLATPYFASVNADLLWNPKTQKMAEILPLERLLLETDAPYPQPPFHHTDVAKQLQATAEKLAEIKGISTEAVLQQCRQNALSFYRLD